MLAEQRRKCPVAANGVDVNGRLHISGRKRPDNILVALGFPATDEDVDYCLEDTPGLSQQNFAMLKASLVQSLVAIRQGAEECVAELETVLSQQIAFRVVPAVEVDRRLQYVVSRFCKARKQVLHKYRGYVRNRRWIENVATRQRRGCLTHRQNNILRLWLFSNFSNPYPDAADKRRLIAQTQLTTMQLNNWLINARSRVWKPTVEIMSGDRVRTEMNSKEDREFDMPGELSTDLGGEYALPPIPQPLHGQPVHEHSSTGHFPPPHLLPGSQALPAPAPLPHIQSQPLQIVGSQSQQLSGSPPLQLSASQPVHISGLHPQHIPASHPQQMPAALPLQISEAHPQQISAAHPQQISASQTQTGAGAQGAAGGVEAIAEEGAWLAQQPWSGLDFGPDCT